MKFEVTFIFLSHSKYIQIRISTIFADTEKYKGFFYLSLDSLILNIFKPQIILEFLLASSISNIGYLLFHLSNKNKMEYKILKKGLFYPMTFLN